MITNLWDQHSTFRTVLHFFEWQAIIALLVQDYVPSSQYQLIYEMTVHNSKH